MLLSVESAPCSIKQRNSAKSDGAPWLSPFQPIVFTSGDFSVSAAEATEHQQTEANNSDGNTR